MDCADIGQFVFYLFLLWICLPCLIRYRYEEDSSFTISYTQSYSPPAEEYLHFQSRVTWLKCFLIFIPFIWNIASCKRAIDNIKLVLRPFDFQKNRAGPTYSRALWLLGPRVLHNRLWRQNSYLPAVLVHFLDMERSGVNILASWPPSLRISTGIEPFHTSPSQVGESRSIFWKGTVKKDMGFLRSTNSCRRYLIFLGIEPFHTSLSWWK